MGTSSKCQQLEKTYNEHGTKVETISAELDVRHTRCEGISHIRGAPGNVNQHVLGTRGYKRSGQSILSAQGIVKNCLASQVCTKCALVDRRVDLRRPLRRSARVHVRAKYNTVHAHRDVQEISRKIVR